MTKDLNHDASYFLELQTKTSWGRILKRFADWCDPQPGERILDIGCGPGLFPALVEAHGALAFGCDLDRAQFSTPLHTQLSVADIYHLPYSNAFFDKVTAANLLFLLPDPENALNQIRRVLQPDGKIYLLNPSENMTTVEARTLSTEAGLTGLARETLLNYAARAEKNYRWSTQDLKALLESARYNFINTKTVMGSGLIRFISGENKRHEQFNKFDYA